MLNSIALLCALLGTCDQMIEACDRNWCKNYTDIHCCTFRHFPHRAYTSLYLDLETGDIQENFWHEHYFNKYWTVKVTTRILDR